MRPEAGPLCTIDVVGSGEVRRIATAAGTAGQAALLSSCLPVHYAGDDAVARVLGSATTEVARRTPVGPGPWAGLGVTGYVCVPLLSRGRAFGALTLFTTADRILDDHTVALAEEVARRASLAVPSYETLPRLT